MSGDAALIMHREDMDGPGTHVLIIGIGSYDYLVGGRLENREVAAGMRQLPAAARSARAAADWFLDAFADDRRPLASLALVLSEPLVARYAHHKANLTGQDLPNGDMEGVAEALDEWVQRSSSDRRNLAVLYFVGHGLHAGSSILLCRDYGKVKGRRFEWAINLDDLLVALATRSVDEQLVMVDACRNADVTDQTLSRGGRAGRNILAHEPLDLRDGMEARQSIHFATSKYTEAWAAEDGVSLFSEALLQALSGGGAQLQHGWQVATGGLQEALTAYVRRAAAEAGLEQVPDRQRAADFIICRPQSLMVPVRVTFAPANLWNDRVRLVVEGDAGPVVCGPELAYGVSGWTLALPKGGYTFKVTFEGVEAYEGTSARETVVPPFAPIDIALRLRENG